MIIIALYCRVHKVEQKDVYAVLSHTLPETDLCCNIARNSTRSPFSQGISVTVLPTPIFSKQRSLRVAKVNIYVHVQMHGHVEESLLLPSYKGLSIPLLYKTSLPQIPQPPPHFTNRLVREYHLSRKLYIQYYTLSRRWCMMWPRLICALSRLRICYIPPAAAGPISVKSSWTLHFSRVLSPVSPSRNNIHPVKSIS